MLEVGDKIICVDAKDIGYFLSKLVLYKQYTIESIYNNGGKAYIELEENTDHSKYRLTRFIHELEYRRLKIKKIKERLK